MSAEVTERMAFGESGSIRFFCAQTVGILLDDSVCKPSTNMLPRESVKPSPVGREKVAKLIGNIWLCVLLVDTSMGVPSSAKESDKITFGMM